MAKSQCLGTDPGVSQEAGDGPEANLTQAHGQEKCHMEEISKKDFKIGI